MDDKRSCSSRDHSQDREQWNGSWRRKVHSCPKARTRPLRVGRLPKPPEPWKPCSEDISPLWLWNILFYNRGRVQNPENP